MAKYYTFERICEVDPESRKLREPRKFQVFERLEDDTLKIVHYPLPLGTRVDHFDLPLSYR